MFAGIPALELIVVLFFIAGFAFLTVTGYRLEKRYWQSKTAQTRSNPGRPGKEEVGRGRI